ncbi:MAG: VCBS repeat-containing protein [Salinibacter sp.]
MEAHPERTWRGGGLSPTLVVCLLLVVGGCDYIPYGGPLFERVAPSTTNIRFSNDLTYNNSFNIYTYRNFYAGGGVALGDVNGDGLLDVYLTANQKSNRLYLNRGDFTFEDVTEEAGVGGEMPWSTGVSMADVNGDGLLDIYVANSGPFVEPRRENELFINNGDGTFTERAQEFGIANVGNSIHSAFFDYDHDGDLDLFVLNNYASKPIEKYNLTKNLRSTNDERGGDRLYRNDDSTFVEVTEKAGIYNSEIGFGLGVSVGDVNRDGWMDMYVSNDFFERDYFYINDRSGGFTEVLADTLSSISTTSMGGDIADLNHDGYPEIFVADMLPRSEERVKTVADFVGWEQFQSEVDMGYHRKFPRNTLHLNNGNGTFSEIGRYTGVEATGWSWGGLIADFNLDGAREIFVPNGFYRDVTNKDLLVRMNTREFMRSVVENNRINYEKLVEKTPSVPLSNDMFEKQGPLRFANRAAEWGLGEPGFSSGSAYGDLDRDGDLDLVVNNVNARPSLYRNRTAERHPERSWVRLALEGTPPNTKGVGAQVEAVADERRYYVEQMPQRGFQSSVAPTLHLGLGSGVSTLDTLKVRWPDGRVSLRTDVEANQQLTLRQDKAQDRNTGGYRALPSGPSEESEPLLEDVTGEMGFDWTHEESAHNDFEQSPLLFHMRSTEGPALCVGDATGDGKPEVYVGGARGQPGALFVQSDDQFEQVPQPALTADRMAEDTDCTFVDATGDGRAELYVASGSSEFPAGSPHLADRLYRLDGERFVHVEGALPRPEDEHTPTGTVRAADVDSDGDQDLFVGTRLAPVSDSTGYGTPVGGTLLENTGTGTFRAVTAQRAPGLRADALESAGVTDAAWGDLNGDGTPDLVVVGEWMPLTIFWNRNGRLERADLSRLGLDHTHGWWQSVALADLDGNGVLDLLAGNHGLNSRFRARPEEPLRMWAGAFGGKKGIEQILATYRGGEGPFPVALRQNLIQRLPYIKDRYPTFESYAGETVPDVFDQKTLERTARYRAEQMASIVGWNDGNGHFRVDSLPFRAQLAPMYDLLAAEIDGRKGKEILMGGNLNAVKPQAGAYEASHGVALEAGSSRTYQEVPTSASGFDVAGEVRALRSLEHDGQVLFIVVRNDRKIKSFRIKKYDRDGSKMKYTRQKTGQ